MVNQENIAEILELATQLNLDAIPLVEVLKGASGSSTALELIPVNSPVRLEGTVEHVHEVLLLDMELFDTAMKEIDAHADAITARAVVGANRLPAIVGILNP